MSTENTSPAPAKKQSSHPSLLLILILINLVFILVILKKQSELTKIRTAIDESNKTIAEYVLNSLTDAGSEKDSTKPTFADSVQSILTNMQSKVEDSNTSLAGTVRSSLADMQSKVEASNKTLAETVKSSIADMQSRMTTTNVSGQAAPDTASNIKATEQAMSLAEQAWRNSDPALATIYVLNALNHNPANMNCLQFYYNILENKRGLEISDIDQFIDILDVSVYQVSPSDVSKVLTMRNTLLSKQESMLNSAAAEVNRDASAQFSATQRALSNGRLSPSEISRSGKINMELLDERIETIAALISDADMSDSDRSSYIKLLNESSTFKLLATTLESAENAVSKAYSLANRNSLTVEQILLARNQLQTANTYLSQIWTIDTTNFQAQLNAAENLQTRIATIDKRLDVLASAPARTKIESKLAECNNLYGSFTSKINKISATLKEAAPLLAEVPDSETRKYLESSMEKAAQQVEELTKSRYKAYQEWAAGQINAAIKQYNSYNVVTDGRAKDMFNTYLLSINTGLLLPDVSTFYNDVYQKIYNELPDKAEHQYKKATYSYIKQLEDF